MRIGIDIRSLIFTRAGISCYTFNLIKALSAVDKENEYLLFCNTKSGYDWSGYFRVKEDVIRFPHLGRFTEKLWEEVFLPQRLLAKKIDVFHSPRYMLPKKKPCHFIVTIHDLSFKRIPQLFTRKVFDCVNHWVEFSVEKADKIIAVSGHTKNDLINLFNAKAEKIEVIYEGVDENFRPVKTPESLKEIKHKYNLPEKFILFVGTIEPRKNIKRLIEAFYDLTKNRKMEHSLVIAGGKGWHYDDVFNTVEKLKLGKKIIFTDYVRGSELPLLYNAADLFVYPSLYEGFGLPPLEAMACGVPVVTSNTSSLPEVVGDAAVLVDPADVQTMAEAIKQTLEDKNLREKMIKQGFIQAKKFSWEATAIKTLNVYERVFKETHL